MARSLASLGFLLTLLLVQVAIFSAEQFTYQDYEPQDDDRDLVTMDVMADDKQMEDSLDDSSEESPSPRLFGLGFGGLGFGGLGGFGYGIGYGLGGLGFGGLGLGYRMGYPFFGGGVLFDEDEIKNGSTTDVAKVLQVPQFKPTVISRGFFHYDVNDETKTEIGSVHESPKRYPFGLVEKGQKTKNININRLPVIPTPGKHLGVFNERMKPVTSFKDPANKKSLQALNDTPVIFQESLPTDESANVAASNEDRHQRWMRLGRPSRFWNQPRFVFLDVPEPSQNDEE